MMSYRAEWWYGAISGVNMGHTRFVDEGLHQLCEGLSAGHRIETAQRLSDGAASWSSRRVNRLGCTLRRAGVAAS